MRQKIVLDRSRCDCCGHILPLRDLIPILSWIFLGRACRFCGLRISAFHPFIEVAATAVVLWAATATSGGVLAASCCFGWLLLTLACIDWRSGLLPDALNGILLLAGLVAIATIDSTAVAGHVIGAAAGFIALAGLALVYRKVRNREGVGLGDAKLLAGIGAWVSWQGLPTVILCGSSLALVYVTAQSLRGKPMKAGDRLAFGPFLAAAGWLVWLYGPLVPA